MAKPKKGRVMIDIESFHQDPPPGIKIAVDESNTNIIHALIFGVPDTPYEGGFFYLVLTMPPSFPFRPPQVKFMTTGGAKVKFNPNFYQCGTVCISFLTQNDWVSSITLNKILVSLQSLLGEKPYHNEEGYEVEKVPGDVERYNQIIIHETLRVAVIGMLDNEYGILMPVDLQLAMKKYFLQNLSFYKSRAQSYFHLNGKTMQDPFGINSGVFDFKAIHQRLKRIELRLMPLASAGSDSSRMASNSSKSTLSSFMSISTPVSPSPKSPQSTVSSPPPPANMSKDTNLKDSRIRRIMTEIKEFKKDPPPGISIAVDEANCTIIHALVIGPVNTPYEGGFFYFVVKYPTTYPWRPPEVKFMTTGGSTVRFNPNLYSSGKVCLSILGTWSGPVWSPAMTIPVVLLSIQSLLNEKPYHNEPGYEEEMSPGGVDKFNEVVKHETLRVAVVGMLDNDHGLRMPEHLQTVMKTHFMNTFQFYKSRAKAHVHLNGKRMEDPFGNNCGQFNYDTILKRLVQINTRLKSQLLSTPSSSSSQQTGCSAAKKVKRE